MTRPFMLEITMDWLACFSNVAIAVLPPGRLAEG